MSFSKTINTASQHIKDCCTLDLRSLAMMRIVLGSAIAVDIIDRWSALSAHYTSQGIVSQQVAATGLNFGPTPLFFIDNAPAMTVFFGIYLLFTLTFTIGYKTTISNILVILLTYFLINRNPFVVFGMDDYIMNFLFIGLFLPLGRRFSLDQPGKKQSSPGLYFSAATIAIIVQLTLIYVHTAYAKCMNPYWRDGTAFFYAMKIQASWANQVIDSFSYLSPVMTYLTIFSQFSILLLWTRKSHVLKAIPFLTLVPAHLTMLVFMNLRAFPLVSVGVLMAIFPFRRPKHQATPIEQISMAKNIIPALFTALILIHSVNSFYMSTTNQHLFLWSNKILQSLNLRQDWFFFSTIQAEESWLQIRIYEKDDGIFEYFRDGPYVNDERYIAYSKWAHIRWFYIFEHARTHEGIQNGLTQFLCNIRIKNQPLKIEMIRFKRTGLLSDLPKPVEKKMVFSRKCFQ